MLPPPHVLHVSGLNVLAAGGLCYSGDAIVVYWQWLNVRDVCGTTRLPVPSQGHIELAFSIINLPELLKIE